MYNMSMYIRKNSRKTKSGAITYVQLAHNEWDPVAKYPKAKVLFTFGREDQLDKKVLEGLMSSLARYLGKEIDASGNIVSDAQIVSCKPLGGAHLLDHLWQELGIGQVIRSLLRERKYQTPVERALFAMCANRALAPSSKLATEEWVAQDVFIPGLAAIDVQNLYRAMDFLSECDEHLQREVFFSVAAREKLEVDVIYFDTTSAYFEPEIGSAGEDGFRMCGNSKDYRAGQPQVVIALAVTREGIPVRCWTFAGNTADQSIVERLRHDLLDWKLGRIISVCDRGFVSEDNLRILQRGGGHCIVGEKMRGGKTEVDEALARKGRYKSISETMEVKEVTVGDGAGRKRYVIVCNAREAEKDRLARERLLDELREKLKDIGELGDKPHPKKICALTSHPSYGKYIKLDGRNGQPILNQPKIKEEEHLDGKYRLICSDDTLSAEEIAKGYKGLYEVEDAFRCLKNELELRPMYHRKEERIRAHILIGWLALVLVRVCEYRCGESWRMIRDHLERIQAVTLEHEGASLVKTSQLSQFQIDLLKRLKCPKPLPILDFRGQSLKE